MSGGRVSSRSRIDCTVLFAKDSDRLRPGAKEKLDRLARQLRAQGPGRLQITGYTDDDKLDIALNGGIHSGYLTEITGERCVHKALLDFRKQD